MEAKTTFKSHRPPVLVSPHFLRGVFLHSVSSLFPLRALCAFSAVLSLIGVVRSTDGCVGASSAFGPCLVQRVGNLLACHAVILQVSYIPLWEEEEDEEDWKEEGQEEGCYE